MKKLALLVLTFGVTVSSYAQGYFFFNNVGAYDGTANASLPRIGSTSGPGEGTPGQNLGSPGYTIGFLWNANLGLAGMDISNNGFRNAAGTQFGVVGGGNGTGFASTTGDTAGGAGIFDGGNGVCSGVTVTGTHVLVQLVAWWSGSGGFANYDAAFANGAVNSGYSSLIDMRLAVGGDPVVSDLGTMPGFTVQPVPEPSTFALAGLGAAALLIFRRRK